ncbi:hypothetical protein F5X68DRAFT_242786 [Plectosphaerella plurivora]|uniref:Uncharacterized protein n=1 Tax=Plectosphaerella plurivora TaxID=936078 RepID=A0A9P8V906_9PEZI|nr:hypothetical protein F5X68DRAFT_242786 [Plectosphaerella plurivora]
MVNAVEEGRGSHPFEEIGLAGKPTPLAKNVWTANEGSPTTRFYQHNEVSNIRFYSVKTADKGGATPVANSAAFLERVLAEIPELVKGIEQRGLGMKMLFRAPGSEGLHNGFNWAGEYSFGQESQVHVLRCMC